MIDELQVARSLRRLDALVAEHPELVDHAAPGWTDTDLAAVLNSETEMVKKTEKPETVPVAFRLEEDLLKRLDKHAERMSKAMPGPKFTRADALKALLIPALDAAERKRRAR